MAWVALTVAKEGFGDFSTPITSRSMAAAHSVAVGDTIVVWSAIDVSFPNTANAVVLTDDLGNTYVAKTPVLDGTNNEQIQAHVCIVTHAGTPTIQAQFGPTPGTSNTDQIDWQIQPFTGSDAASIVDGSTGQLQTAPTTAADALTSGAVTTTLDGALIVSATCDTSSGADPATKGTGFTDGDVTSLVAVRTEYRTQTTHGSVAGTWKATANTSHVTAVVAISPATVATAPGAGSTRNDLSLRPAALIAKMRVGPWGMVAEALRALGSTVVAALSPQIVTPGVAALVITGFAPTVSVSNNVTVAPGTGVITIAGQAPTVATTGNQVVAPGSGTITLSGFAATVAVSNHKVVAPGVGVLTVTGFAPLVTTTPRSYHTAFAATENPMLDAGAANFIQGGTVGIGWTNVSCAGGKAIGHQVGASFTDATCVLDGPWNPDQWARATVFSQNPNDAYFQECELRLRTTIGANSIIGYEIGFKVTTGSDPYLIIVRWNGAVGDFTYIRNLHGAQYGCVDGDVLTAAIVGNTISVWKNGTLMVTASTLLDKDGGTLVAITSGAPGMGFNLENSVPGASGTNGDYGFTDFVAGDSIVGAVAPGTGVLTLNGFAPTVSTGANKTVAPGVGSVTLSGFAPTIAVSDNKNVQPGAGVVVVTGFAPNVASSNAKVVAPDTATITLTGLAPTVQVSDNKLVAPGAGALLAAGFAPLVFASSPQTVAPGVGNLIVTGFPPTVSVTAIVVVPPIAGMYKRQWDAAGRILKKKGIQ